MRIPAGSTKTALFSRFRTPERKRRRPAGGGRFGPINPPVILKVLSEKAGVFYIRNRGLDETPRGFD